MFGTNSVGQPAFVLYVQTFDDLVTFNPHIHALVDDADVIERILRHLDRWDPTPEVPAEMGTIRAFSTWPGAWDR